MKPAIPRIAFTTSQSPSRSSMVWPRGQYRAEVQAKVGVNRRVTPSMRSASSQERGDPEPDDQRRGLPGRDDRGKSHATGLAACFRCFRFSPPPKWQSTRCLSLGGGDRRPEPGHRTLASHFGILNEPPDPVVDLYFKQCSISVTCRESCGHGGDSRQPRHHPLTANRRYRGRVRRSVLSGYASCACTTTPENGFTASHACEEWRVRRRVIAVLPANLEWESFHRR